MSCICREAAHRESSICNSQGRDDASISSAALRSVRSRPPAQPRPAQAAAERAAAGLGGTSVYLVGMMGSGKSTVGRMVARALRHACLRPPRYQRHCQPLGMQRCQRQQAKPCRLPNGPRNVPQPVLAVCAATTVASPCERCVRSAPAASFICSERGAARTKRRRMHRPVPMPVSPLCAQVPLLRQRRAGGAGGG